VSIEEVIRASEARTSAVSQYYRVIASRNRDEIETARRLAAGQEEALSEWGAEASEAARERAATATQVAALGESAQRRASLDDAQKTLQGIAVSVGERVTLAEQQILKKAGEENTPPGKAPSISCRMWLASGVNFPMAFRSRR
jgi:hypothetical protein